MIRLFRHHEVDTSPLSPNANKPTGSFLSELMPRLRLLVRLNQHDQVPPDSTYEYALNLDIF